MANLHVSTSPLIARATPHPAGVGSAPDALRSAKRSASPQLASALESAAGALKNIQSSLDQAHTALRNAPPEIHQIRVTDNAGKVIAAIGNFEYRGVVTPNYFSEIHVGDPLKTGNPALALFNATPDGKVTIGQNGSIDVLDPFGADAAWIGTQPDTLAVTGAVSSGVLIRLTVTAHTLATGDSVTVKDVGGVPNATGIFTVTKIDANHVDLQSSVFVGTYTSGGVVNRLLHITGAANSGAGLIRITIVAHGFETGDKVNILSIGGVPNATSQWIITVIDADHFDLQASTWAGAYTSGGLCLRYFAGMLAQTIAIGPDFVDYKLRAFADGSLRIRDAIINLVTGDGHFQISFDPQFASVTMGSTVNGENEIYIQQGIITARPHGHVDPSATMEQQGFFVNNATGIVAAMDIDVGTGTGQIGLSDATNTQQIHLDGDTGNIDAVSYSVGGVAGATTSLPVPNTAIGLNGLSVTTQFLQYKDWAGANQGVNAVVAVTLALTSHQSTGGLVTA